MSDFSKAKLPENIPQCKCFQTDAEYTWKRCGDIAEINSAMCGVFHELTEHYQMCPSALMFALEGSIVSLLAYIAKANNLDLGYGSDEIEVESARLLKGLEERVLGVARLSYETARKYGMTEEKWRAMQEGTRETKQ